MYAMDTMSAGPSQRMKLRREALVFVG